MRKVTDRNYDEIVGRSEIAVVLGFGSAWCASCKKVDAVLEEIEREMAGRVLVGKVDILASPATAEKLGVLGVPTVVFLRDGKPVFQFSGEASREKFVRMLSEYLDI